MASRLTPCPSCTRHVKVGSPSCPFCGGEVPTDVPLRGIPAGRALTRAALLFAGSAAVAACSSSSGGQPLPAYGVAVFPDAGSGTGSGGGQFDAAYGVFVHPDAGSGTGSGSGSPRVDDGGVVAAYGVFAFDSGAHDSGTGSGDNGNH